MGTPARLLQAIIVLTMACGLGIALFAAGQPSTGLTLLPAGETVTMAHDGRALGPVVLSNTRTSIQLEPGDLRAVPDTIPSYEAADRFFARQTILAEMLKGPTTVSAGATRYPVSPGPRGLADLPTLFWMQLLSGMAACIIAGFIWALGQKSAANRLFGVTGPLFLMLTGAAAIYSTRDLAIDGALFETLGTINEIGADLFGLAMVLLFLVYPRRIAPLWILGAFTAATMVWIMASLASLLPRPTDGSHLIVAIELLALAGVIALQFVVTRGDPVARASLLWLGASVLVGAGSFIALIVLPILFGQAPEISEGAAFPLFLIIYGGLVLGLRRYRLFEARAWSFHILFAAGGTAMLCIVDAALVSMLSLGRDEALGASLLLIGTAYLPARAAMMRRVRGRGGLREDEMFAAAIDVAFAPPGRRDQRWRALLVRLFQPLEIQPKNHDGVARVAEDGTVLLVPASASGPALRLAYAASGRRLFTQQDTLLVEALIHLTGRAADALLSHERGAAQERRRMAQDLHDDVGARLLSAIPIAQGSVRQLLQDALRDIRTLVTGLIGDNAPFPRVIAEIRRETATRLEAAGIELDWPIAGPGEADHIMNYTDAKAITSAIREGVSNAIRHGGTTRMIVGITLTEGVGTITIADRGCGIAPDAVHGTGLKGMASRMAGIGGTFAIDGGHDGTRLILTWPLLPASSPMLGAEA